MLRKEIPCRVVNAVRYPADRTIRFPPVAGCLIAKWVSKMRHLLPRNLFKVLAIEDNLSLCVGLC